MGVDHMGVDLAYSAADGGQLGQFAPGPQCEGGPKQC